MAQTTASLPPIRRGSVLHEKLQSYEPLRPSGQAQNQTIINFIRRTRGPDHRAKYNNRRLFQLAASARFPKIPYQPRLHPASAAEEKQHSQECVHRVGSPESLARENTTTTSRSRSVHPVCPLQRARNGRPYLL